MRQEIEAAVAEAARELEQARQALDLVEARAASARDALHGAQVQAARERLADVAARRAEAQRVVEDLVNYEAGAREELDAVAESKPVVTRAERAAEAAQAPREAEILKWAIRNGDTRAVAQIPKKLRLRALEGIEAERARRRAERVVVEQEQQEQQRSFPRVRA